ncbi:uncharacterized protein TRIVIDRAFT_81530 [Trichoderma virens Gv29-8]|uniref:Tat pathway signal sequence n=1 Tax=Hypocrea virens (strain Gv29-8 / FGSC 10586) TaxID=413071 RepID=G9MG56_HYPVG|nr:uncharacterized protein TRIVIDRAFT_81530 [Trichoderma virens Gv29-8]EHK26506.1 hypothetical protein TRIVIDRAFT_81530 [Trichoderma virens Gv29-8]UKZ46685.1 hypothetical protein TrVGV298_000892 [Trichoderma virens]
MVYTDTPKSSSDPPQYAEKSSISSDEPTEEESLLQMMGNHTTRRSQKKRSCGFSFDLKHWIVANILLTMINLAFVVGLTVLWQKGRLFSQSPRMSSTVALLPPSPATDAVEKELRPFSLVSPYNAHPGPETDKLWHNLVNTGAMFPLSEEQFSEVNDSPSTGVKFTHDPQGRYLGTLASTHQIHCVDSLRKGLWFHYKHYKALNDPLFIDKDPPEKHLMHCVEMLRNAVMCFGDVSVITYNWKRGHPGPKASFKSMHACQKWHKIEEWRIAHNVTEHIKTLERPVGILDGPIEEDDTALGGGGGAPKSPGSGGDDDDAY